MLKGNADLKYALGMLEDCINEKSDDTQKERYDKLAKVKTFIDIALIEEISYTIEGEYNYGEKEI